MLRRRLCEFLDIAEQLQPIISLIKVIYGDQIGLHASCNGLRMILMDACRRVLNSSGVGYRRAYEGLSKKWYRTSPAPRRTP